ncbi:MAG TPA: porin [Gammaproteobacteria bacterium]
MQKKLLTMAVAGALAAPVAAFAQVTLYGSIDTGIKNQSKLFTGVGTNTGSKMSVDPQIKKSNRWGLKSSDDLGGGLMANFNLEGGFNSDNGTGLSTGGGLDFARRAVLGFSKGGNNVDLGREYTLNFKTQGIYDPLSHDYGSAAGIQGGVGTAGTRTSDSITAGFRFGTGGVAVQYGMGEQVDDNGSGSYKAINGDMTFGPVTVGAAWGSREAVAPLMTDTTTINVGGAYKMGAFTFRLGLATEEIDTGNESTKISGGVQYDFSPTLTGRVSLYDLTVDNSGGAEIGSARTAVVNVEYSLSKRTLVYVVFDRKTLEGNQLTGAAGTPDDGATGIAAGITHVF